jgi:glucose-6-phosphate-specific signal transduction histidine kinase
MVTVGGGSRWPMTAQGSIPSTSATGTGLQGIADRLGALAGTLTVTSSISTGITVVGIISVPPD